jgi:hypothetical protein
MFGMSVNDVPGWLVAIAPRGIGVPVAATPGLVPHCDVLTAEVLGVPLDVAFGVLLVLLLLPHPAAARIPAIATTATPVRTPRVYFRLVTYPPPPGG